MLVDDFKPGAVLSLPCSKRTPNGSLQEGSDGIEAIQKAEQFHADLIVLDIGLRELSGIEAAPSIRKAALGSKILFLSENCERGVVAWSNRRAKTNC